MADYYPLLVRAISSLPQNTAENRRAVFDRARAALMRQLRSVDPPLPEGEITRERLTLEEAIRRVEADLAPQDNAPEDELSSEAEAPEPDSSDADRSGGFAPHEPAREPDTSPPAVDSRPEKQAGSAPLPPPVMRAGGDGPTDSNAPGQKQDAARGPLPPGKVRSRQAAKEASKDGALRPGLRPTEKPAPSWKKPAVWALLAAVVLIAIILGVINRDAFFGGAPKPPQQIPAASSQPAERPKSEDRVATTSADQGRRAPASAPRQQAAGTQRAVLLEESPGGTSPPQSFEGTVTWRTETFEAGPGLPPEMGVRGVITIPERQISMDFVLRRNADQTLPASHTIELQFKLPKDFAFGGIASIPGIRVKPNQQAQGVPLAGLAVRVNPELFLIGLSTVPAERQRNIMLMQMSPWFDVPFVYTNNKRAVILFDKGDTGDQVFQEVFAAWGELIERNPAQQQAPAQQ